MKINSTRPIPLLFGCLMFVVAFAAEVWPLANIYGQGLANTNTLCASNAPAPPSVKISNETDTVLKVSSDKDAFDMVNIGAATFSALGALLAAIFAWRATIQAQEAARETQKTATQTNLAAKQAEETARNQRLAELFADIQKLTYLTPDELNLLGIQPKNADQKALDKQIGEKVVNNLNIMEKIAFCWDKNLVDRAQIEEEVKPFFTKLYKQIQDLPKIEWLARDGKRLIEQSPRATDLRNHLLTQSTP